MSIVRLLILGLLVFAALLLLMWGIYQSWHTTKSPEAERVARRLRNAIGDAGSELAVSITKERLLSRDPGLQRLLKSLPPVLALDRLLQQSGMGGTVARLLAMIVAAPLLVLLLTSLAGLGWPLRLVLTALAGALPVMMVSRAKQKRLDQIDSMLPDALDMMGRAMRAGHAFPTTLKMIADEMPQPLAGEFRAVFDEVNFGVAMQDALMNLAQRVPSTDLRYFVVAVLIQRETGGNLTELLTSISAIIRDRIKLLGQVKVMSAEGKMSAKVLGALPFGAAAMMYFTNAEFLMPLYTDPSGRKMLSIAGTLMVIGFFVIRKITHIRV